MENPSRPRLTERGRAVAAALLASVAVGGTIAAIDKFGPEGDPLRTPNTPTLTPGDAVRPDGTSLQTGAQVGEGYSTPEDPKPQVPQGQPRR